MQAFLVETSQERHYGYSEWSKMLLCYYWELLLTAIVSINDSVVV